MVQPRREPRYIVPAISVCIDVEFLPEARLPIGRLWDVSRSGACLLFPRRHAVAVGQSGPLILKPPSIGEPIRTRAEILWVDRMRIASVLPAGSIIVWTRGGNPAGPAGRLPASCCPGATAGRIELGNP